MNLETLGKLKLKSVCFNFNKNLAEKMINVVKDRKDRFGPKSKSQIRKHRIIWATSFNNILKVSSKEVN